MFFILGSWIVAFFVLFGLGLLLRGEEHGRRKIDIFWTGFVGAILFCQTYQLFWPLDKFALTFLTLFSTLGWYRRGRTVKFCRSQVFITVLVSFMVGFSAFSGVSNYDTHLYHLNAVKWAHDYPIIKGLGNLHFRLAFNSDFFNFAALFDNGKGAGRSAYTCLSFLLVAVIITIISLAIDLKRSADSRLFCLAMAVMFYISLEPGHISSLQSDGASQLTAVMALTYLMADELDLALILAVVTTCFKLSTLPILAIVTGFYLCIHALHRRPIQKTMVGVALAMMGLHLVRGAILSGWLLYPFPYFNLHLPWTVPDHITIWEYRYIQSWAKWPGKDPKFVLDNGLLHWFLPWWGRFYGTLACYLLVLGGLLGVVGVLVSRFKATGARWRNLILYLCLLAATASWLFLAPDTRFGMAFMAPLFAIGMTMALGNLWARIPERLSKIMLVVVFSMVFLLQWQENESTFWAKLTGIPARLGSAMVHQVPSKISGVVSPVDGDQCSNSEVLCTPRAYEGLRAFENDFRHGFFMEKESP